MNNSNNNNWITENPLLKNKNQRYYYDFGTGKQSGREAFPGSSGIQISRGKDHFLEGFNDPYGEKQVQARRENLAKIRTNAENRSYALQSSAFSQSDPFLAGFIGTSTEENNRITDLFKEKESRRPNSYVSGKTEHPSLKGFSDTEENAYNYKQKASGSDRVFNDLQSTFRVPQFDSKLKSPVQRSNSSPSITTAINRNLNAKNEFEYAIGDPNKEPVMVKYTNEPSPNKTGRSHGNAWSYKNDEQGISILSHWLFGGGKDYIQEDGVWGDYMKSNEALTVQVKNIVLPLADDLGLNESKEVDITMPMKIDTGESIIGYQYLHGTNAEVGDFQIKGKVYKDEKGDVIYDLTYTWNDKIDPNYNYDTDAEKAEFAKSIPFANPQDYIIRISWHDKTKIRANPGLFNRNSGWLK